MQIEAFADSLQFISQGGAVSIIVAVGLCAMSVGSWTLMLIKAIQARRLKRSSAKFLLSFWQESSVAAALTYETKQVANPFVRLAQQGLTAAEHHNRYSSQRAGEARNFDEFVAHALRRVMGQEAMRLENGLTLLASVGSIAPFVGLFGTVWGIYHALGTIAVGGQATVDKVAGPVGEALIMTAFGLAVAIPAVLAYNTLVRENRLLMGEMETFAHDLHTYLTTGVPMTTELTQDSVEPQLTTAAVFS